MSIGQRIKAIRKQRGLSIDELANAIGKNRTTIYRYENGDIENLPLGILGSLASALDTTPAYLMGWDQSDHASLEFKYFSKWFIEYGLNVLSEEECSKILEYAKFIVSQRGK